MFPAERPEFGQGGQQGVAQHRPHAGDALQQIVLGPPHGTRPDARVQLTVQVGHAALEPADVLADVAAQVGGGHAQTVLLRDQHLEELAAPGQQGLQGLGGVIGEGPRRWPYALSEQRQDLGIDRVRLGQLPRRPSEGADLAGIGDDDGHAGRGQRGGDGMLVAAGCFEDYERGAQRANLPQQGLDARLIVGTDPTRSRRSHGHIQGRFRHVDADKHGGLAHLHLRARGALVLAQPCHMRGGPPINCSGSRRAVDDAPAKARSRGPAAGRAVAHREVIC